MIILLILSTVADDFKHVVCVSDQYRAGIDWPDYLIHSFADHVCVLRALFCHAFFVQHNLILDVVV